MHCSPLCFAAIIMVPGKSFIAAVEILKWPASLQILAEALGELALLQTCSLKGEIDAEYFAKPVADA